MTPSARDENLNSKSDEVDWHSATNDNVWDADFQYKDGVRFDNGDSYLQTDWANLVYSDLEKSAERGSIVAQSCLSHMFQEGFGVGRDPEKAFKWCAIAAQQEGQADAMFELGLMYLNGHGVTRCVSSAYKLLKSAGDYNHAEALFKLAEMQIDDSYGKADTQLAFNTCFKAAKLDLPEAQFNVGVMFEKGIGTDQSFRDSVFWYEKAAHNGNMHAFNNLGDMYFNGRGVPEDKSMADHLFNIASDQGSGLADFNLAIIHSQCQHSEGQPLHSLKLLSMAASKGVEEADRILNRLKKIFPLGVILAVNARACAALSRMPKTKK